LEYTKNFEDEKRKMTAQIELEMEEERIFHGTAIGKFFQEFRNYKHIITPFISVGALIFFICGIGTVLPL